MDFWVEIISDFICYQLRMVCGGIYALDVPFRCFDLVVMKVWCYCTNSNLWLSKARELYQREK